jgi:uncharacterized protein (TIGR02118 family)
VITRVFFGARRGDLTTEQCLAHWRGTHAQIGASMPGVRRYVQNHGVLAGGRFLLPYPGFDIMPELDWDGLEAMDAAIDSPAHATDSLDDEVNFLDTTRTAYTVTTRRVLRDVAPGDQEVKLITLLRRAPAAPRDAFESALTGAHAQALAGSVPGRHELLLSVPPRQGKPPFAVDAVDIVWFPQPEDALAWLGSDVAYTAGWQLAGVAIGTERLIARPNRVV